MKKKFKVFVIKYRDWYWYEGDEGDGQWWVKDPQWATLYSEPNAKKMESSLKYFSGEQYDDDGNGFSLEELPVLEEIER